MHFLIVSHQRISISWSKIKAQLLQCLYFKYKIKFHHSLIIIPDGACLSFQKLVFVKVHHLLFSGNEVQFEWSFQLHKFLQKHAQDELVGQWMDALDCVDQL